MAIANYSRSYNLTSASSISEALRMIADAIAEAVANPLTRHSGDRKSDKEQGSNATLNRSGRDTEYTLRRLSTTVDTLFSGAFTV